MTPDKQPTDEDMQKATAALFRAAKRAREIARQTGTAIAYVRDGKLVYEYPGNEYQNDATTETKKVSE